MEQDLIKLRLFSELSLHVASCLFLMVDSYAGNGRSWAHLFQDLEEFKAKMCTRLVRDWAPELLSATIVEKVVTPRLQATLNVCEVFCPPAVSQVTAVQHFAQRLLLRGFGTNASPLPFITPAGSALSRTKGVLLEIQARRPP